MDERRCEHCGASLEGRRPQARFCDDRCRRHAHRAREAGPPLRSELLRLARKHQTRALRRATDAAERARAAEAELATLRADHARLLRTLNGSKTVQNGSARAEAPAPIPMLALPSEGTRDLGGGRRINAHGYVFLVEGGKWTAEHRWVMERMLGRPLGPRESVHHRNGVRHDNRPENLELWVGPIRYGQRAADVRCPHCGKAWHE